MIIDNRYKRVLTCGSVIRNVLFTSDNEMCEHLPVHGYYESMKRHFAGDDGGNFERFCEYIEKEAADYDPTVITDEMTKEYLSPIITESHEPYIHKYLDQLRFSFYRHTSTRSYKNIEAVNIESKDITNEEGESVPQTFFLEEKKDETEAEIKYYRKKLPFLLINLHNKGKCFGISTLSCIRAAMLDGTVRAFHYSNMKKFGIWKMNKVTGKCMEVLTASNGHFQNYFKDWLNGKYKDIAYSDLEEFIRICNSLNVDFNSLDPREYDQDFIDSLECEYFTPNNELVARNIEAQADKRREYGNDSLEYTDSSYIFPYIEKRLKRAAESNIELTVEAVMNSFIGAFGVFNKSNFEILKYLDITDGGEYFDENGFLTDSYGSLMLLDASVLMNDNMQDRSAIYHKAGYLVIVSDSRNTITYLPPKLTAEYVGILNEGINKELVSFTYNGVKRTWGEWITCVI